MRTIALIFSLSTMLCAQTPAALSLTPGIGSRGQTVVLTMNLNIPTGTLQPATLGWTTSFPAADITSVTATEAQALTTATKKIICGDSVIKCLALGITVDPSGTITSTNSNSIVSGPVASLAFVLANNPADTNIPITISSISAADPTGTSIPITATNSTITVQQALTVVCPSLTVLQNTAMPPTSVAITSGSPPYSISATGLPTGVTMDSTGLMTGTPTVNGTFSYNVTATDSANNTITSACFYYVTPANCSTYKTTRTPVGPVLVYRNGLLQKSPGDYTLTYTAGSHMPIINPVNWVIDDSASTVYSKAVPLSFTYQGQSVTYWGYTLNREDWSCATGKAMLTPPPIRKAVPVKKVTSKPAVSKPAVKH